MTFFDYVACYGEFKEEFFLGMYKKGLIDLKLLNKMVFR